MNSLDQSE
jgi:hypothetical protein